MNGQEHIAVEPDASQQSPGLGWNEIKTELVAFFASIKLAMFLFIVLAMTATIGTVIQQGERPETYIKEYGEEAYRWFLRLGFTDVYHTWWFTDRKSTRLNSSHVEISYAVFCLKKKKKKKKENNIIYI